MNITNTGKLEAGVNEHGNTETPHDGKRAKITALDHPWYDAIAECLGARIMGGQWYMIMRDVESYTEFGVSNGKELQWIY